MKTPADLKYTKNDEWVRVKDDVVTMGVTDYAQDQLSDVVFVEIVAFEGDQLDPSVEEAYLAAIHKTNPDVAPIDRIDRFDFYDKARGAFAVVMTGETAKYGNILLKKGVTPCE